VILVFDFLFMSSLLVVKKMVESGSDDLKEIEDGDGEGAVLPLSLPFILCFFKKI
jgi:hypothetical protein